MRFRLRGGKACQKRRSGSFASGLDALCFNLCPETSELLLCTSHAYTLAPAGKQRKHKSTAASKIR
jgi:hypothetical protein